MRGRHVPFSAGFRAMFRLHCLRPVSRSKQRGEARLQSVILRLCVVLCSQTCWGLGELPDWGPASAPGDGGPSFASRSGG